jgi:hypothetical protein
MTLLAPLDRQGQPDLTGLFCVGSRSPTLRRADDRSALGSPVPVTNALPRRPGRDRYEPAILTFGSGPDWLTSVQVRAGSPRMTAAASRIELMIDW